jgi:glycosyltransferase 2 family protein
MRRRLRIGVGLGVGLFFAWLTFRDVAWSDIVEAVASLPVAQVGLGIGCLAAAYAVRIWRWQRMLRIFSPRVRYAQAAGPFVASFAINNLVPLRAGDVARVFAFEAEIGVAPSRVAATLVMERLLDLLALLVFLMIGLSQLTIVAPTVRDVAISAMGAGVVVLLAVMLMPRRIYSLLVWMYRDRGFGGLPLVRVALRFGMRLMIALRRLSTPSHLGFLSLLSLVSWALEGGVFYAVAAQDLARPADASLALATSTLMTLVPGTPGHVGTFDFGARLGYSSLGMDPASATAAALMAHALVWLPITLAGGVWLALRGLSGRRTATVSRSST